MLSIQRHYNYSGIDYVLQYKYKIFIYDNIIYVFSHKITDS